MKKKNNLLDYEQDCWIQIGMKILMAGYKARLIKKGWLWGMKPVVEESKNKLRSDKHIVTLNPTNILSSPPSYRNNNNLHLQYFNVGYNIGYTLRGFEIETHNNNVRSLSDFGVIARTLRF